MDSTLNRFLSRGTAAQMAAFTPSPPTPASGPSSGYIWYQTDTGDTYAWTGSAWAKVNSVTGSGGGGLVLLEQHTASASASLNFTTFYSATYDQYQVEILEVVPATNAVELLLQFSTDGGSTYANTAYYYRVVGSYSSSALNAAYGTGGVNQSSLSIFNPSFTLSSGSGDAAYASLKLGALANSSRFKTVHGTIALGFSNGTDWVIGVTGGVWKSTTAVNAMKFFLSSGNIASGVIRVYGIAKS